MAYPRGMELHGSTWRVVKRIPIELLHLYAPKKKLLYQTGIADKRAAAVAAMRWLAEVEEEFQRVRETGSRLKQVASPEEVSHLVALMVRSSLAANEEARDAGDFEPDEAFAQAMAQLDTADEETRLAISRRIFGGDLPAIVEDWLQAHGYAVEPGSDTFRGICVAFAKGRAEAIKAKRLRAAGEWVETPPLPVLVKKAPASRHHLADALPIWMRLKDPATATCEIYEAACTRFQDHFPGLYVEQVERKHLREYVEWLQTAPSRKTGKPVSAKTIEKEHGALRALFGVACEYEWIAENPAKGVPLPVVKGSKVRSYTPEEVRAIFSSPVFVGGHRPIAGKGEAAFWMPLLMLFTGARREEIAQLTAARVREEQGTPYLAIDPIDEEGRLKTDESKRAVPVHRWLLRMGFLEYVEECRARGEAAQLFPDLKPNKRGQYAGKWGDWWSRYVRGTVGITDDRIQPAHSFRHLLVTECRRLMFREDYERALVGHSGGSKRRDAHDGYGEHLVPSLAAELNRVDFRGLDLSHLYRD